MVGPRGSARIPISNAIEREPHVGARSETTRTLADTRTQIGPDGDPAFPHRNGLAAGEVADERRADGPAAKGECVTPSGRNRRRGFYVGVWVDAGEYERLKRAATENKTSMSELLRRAIPPECSNNSDSDDDER